MAGEVDVFIAQQVSAAYIFILSEVLAEMAEMVLLVGPQVNFLLLLEMVVEQ